MLIRDENDLDVHQGATAYTIPDIVINDLSNRKLKVLTIGSGVSGILMAYHIQKHCQNVEHVMYEKNADIGGTWFENRYPGVGCDIPSHSYTFNFALNPDWPRYLSPGADVQNYLQKVCEVFDLKQYMTFNTEVIGCYWDDDAGEWLVKLRQILPGHEPREIEDRCHILLPATGPLNNYQWPDTPGLFDKFKGRVCHTADWPEDYKAEQWKVDRVAIIGSGSSAVQVLPAMQPTAKHIDTFIRTGVWFVKFGDEDGQDKIYSQAERDGFRKDPASVLAYAKEMGNAVSFLWGMFFSGSETQENAKATFGQRMKDWIKDERLLRGFTPNFGIGCRRVTPGDDYMLAIQKENVDVHFTPVVSCTEDGVIGEDGIERKCDAIVCATGFDVSYRPRFPVCGKGGIDLRDKWAGSPEGYLGLACPDMPNMITFFGPSWPVLDGSTLGSLDAVAGYVLQMIKKMQVENLKSWAPKQGITDAFNKHAQAFFGHTVLKDNCRSWYKDETGRINAVWPGSSLHYQATIATPRYEDFEYEYRYQNPWAYLGMGWTAAQLSKDGDKSPYLDMKNLDPKWIDAVYTGNKRDEKMEPIEHGKHEIGGSHL